MHRSLPVCRPVDRFIVNRHKMRIARQLQVCLDERRAQRYRFAERSHGIFWSMSRSSSMGNN
jgi:hypothetical protein